MFGIWNVHTFTWRIIQTLINFDDYCFQRVVQPPTRIWFPHQQKTLQTPILLDVRDAVNGNDLKPLKSSAGKRDPANLQSATKTHAQCLAQLIFRHLFSLIFFLEKATTWSYKARFRSETCFGLYGTTLHLAQWRSPWATAKLPTKVAKMVSMKSLFTCGGLMVERTNTMGLLESRASNFFCWHSFCMVFVWGTLVSLIIFLALP